MNEPMKGRKIKNLEALCHMSEIQTMQLLARSEVSGESH